MSVSLISVIFIWLLQWTAESTETSVKTHNFTTVMTDEVTGNSTQGQMSMHILSTSNPPVDVSGHKITQPTIGDANPIVETTQTMPSKTFLTNMQTAATPTKPISSSINIAAVSEKSTTEIQFNATKSATVVTSHANNSPAATTVPLGVSHFTQSQNTGKTSTFQFTSDQTTHRSTVPGQLTHVISTITKSTKPPDQSTNTRPSPVTIMTKTPFIHITKAKTTEVSQQKKPETIANKATNHGKTVAGLIGGALVLMMVGFLVIFIKKRRFQKQQISTTEWAGPSPFLEGGGENGQTTRQSPNRISLSSFLPQRLSKRLSLLQETDEELEEMTSGTTFANQHQGCTFGREADREDVQKSSGTAAGVPEKKSTKDAPETVENSVSVNSSPTNNLHSTNDNSDAANLSEDSANLLTVSEAVENPLAQQNNDLK